MRDQTIEERLRAALRAEADALPLTVTTDELERRLVLRRRERTTRRFGLLAAGVAVIAVGAVFVAALGSVRGPTVASTPQPTMGPSGGLPSPNPTSAPARLAEPLGAGGQAVLVRAVGGDGRRPDSYEVSLFDPIAETSVVLTTIPGSVLPDDGWIDGSEWPPAVSRTGYLAMPFTRGPNEDDRYPAIAIVDVRATRDTWILDRYTDPTWGPTEQLVARTWPVSEAHVAWVPPGEGRTERVPGGLEFAGWSSDEDARFVGTRDDASGFVDFNGRFTATTDLPAVYQRTGLERPAGTGARTIGVGCDSSGGEATGGCVLVETITPGELGPVWHDYATAGGLTDFAWAVDGRGVWLLLEGPATADQRTTELAFAESPAKHVQRSSVVLPVSAHPTIIGIAEESAPGRASVVVIGNGNHNPVSAFVLGDGRVIAQDGTAWFAGWADDPAPYDPD